MLSIKRKALVCCLAAMVLLAAGCGGRSADETDKAGGPVSSVHTSSALQASGEPSAQTARPDEAELPDPSAQAAGEAEQESAAEQEEVYIFDRPEAAPEGRPAAETRPEPVPASYIGELEFQAYAFGADPAYGIRSRPGRVCKTREELARLVEELEEAAPGCSRMLEICDPAFFEEKAILFAPKDSSGLYGGSAYDARREETGVTVFVDSVRAYGLPGPTRYDELYFLAVDARLVSSGDPVTACYKERDWAAQALGEGQRAAEPGQVFQVNIRPLQEGNYQACHAVSDPEQLGSGIFRSRQELDDWLSAVNAGTVVNLPGEGMLLNQKIESLHMDFDTAALVVYFSYGVSDYLGAAVDGETVRLGYRQGGGGCIPDSGLYVLLQPVALQTLGEASRIEYSLV